MSSYRHFQISLVFTNLGVDLDLAVRRDQEIFSVCLFDRGHCLGDVTEYVGGGGPVGLWDVS